MSEYTPTTEDLIAALRRKAEFHNHFHMSRSETGILLINAADRIAALAARDAEVRAQALEVTDEMVNRTAHVFWDAMTREQPKDAMRAALEAAFRENGSSDS